MIFILQGSRACKLEMFTSLYKIVWRDHIVVYVVIGLGVVSSENSPSAYIGG